MSLCYEKLKTDINSTISIFHERKNSKITYNVIPIKLSSFRHSKDWRDEMKRKKREATTNFLVQQQNKILKNAHNSIYLWISGNIPLVYYQWRRREAWKFGGKITAVSYLGKASLKVSCPPLLFQPCKICLTMTTGAPEQARVLCKHCSWKS